MVLLALICLVLSSPSSLAWNRGVIERDGQRYLHADLVRASGVYNYTWHPGSGNLTLRDGVTPFMLFAGRDRASKGYVDIEVRAPLVEEEGEPYISEDFVRDHLKLDPGALALREVDAPSGIPAENPDFLAVNPTREVLATLPGTIEEPGFMGDTRSNSKGEIHTGPAPGIDGPAEESPSSGGRLDPDAETPWESTAEESAPEAAPTEAISSPSSEPAQPGTPPLDAKVMGQESPADDHASIGVSASERRSRLISLLTGKPEQPPSRLVSATASLAGDGVVITLGFDPAAPRFDLRTVEKPRALLVTLYGVSAQTDLIGSHPASQPVTEMLVEPSDGDRMTVLLLCSEPVRHASSVFGSSGITISVNPAVSGSVTDDSVALKEKPGGDAVALSPDRQGSLDKSTIDEPKAAVSRGQSTRLDPVKPESPPGGSRTAETSETAMRTSFSRRVDEAMPLKPLQKERPLDGALGSGMALRGVRVDIDPGHGGRDPGIETGDGPTEKEICLRVSLILSKLLNQAGADVRLSREDDKTLSGSERTHFFKERQNTLDISIHCGHTANPSISGPVVVTSNDAGLPAAEAIAGSMGNSLGAEVKEPIIAPIFIFREPNPGIMIEIGFLTHPEERSRLRTDDYAARIARAILYGIYHSFRKR